MGAATAGRLLESGREVIGIDLTPSDITADLSRPGDRVRVLDAVADRDIEGVVTFAGVSGFGDRPGSFVVSVNYFGSVRILEGLRPTLARHGGAAVAISSNMASVGLNVDDRLVDACLEGDETTARALADEVGGPAAYSASKLAIARWVRRQATTQPWAGSGVRLNAIAPGHVDTALTAEMLADPATAPLINHVPLPIGRPGTAREVAALADLLLGPDGGFFVGSVIYIDGGTDAHYLADDWPVARRRTR
jgi:NAD(P)-dependent dehydrogenase (short-subunit alcohol dehydrogenase family)